MMQTIDLLSSGRRWLLISVIASLVGCSSQATPPAPSKAPAQANVVEPPTNKLSSLHRGKPVSEDEALALATALQATVDAQDASGFASHFDWDAFGKLVLSEFEGDNAEARGFRNGFAKGLATAGPRLADQIFKQLAGGGTYTFLRSIDRPEGPRLLFRLRTPENAINYHEICLARRAQGVCAVDLFVYASGERMSETMQRIMLAALPPDKRTLWASLSGSAKRSLQRVTSLKDMTEAFQRGEAQRAIDIYQSLPRELQQEKAIQLIRVMATQKIDDTTYAAVLDEYLTAFPNDPSVHLMSIDAHFLAKRFDKAREALDRLDKQVGGDPYLLILRGNTFVLEGQLDLAEKLAQDLLAEDARNLDAHWLLVSASLQRRDFYTTTRLLTKIRDDLGVTLADLTQLPDYAEFVASPAYAQWQKSSPK